MAVRDQARVLYRLPEQRRFGASGLPAMLTLVLLAVILFLGGLVVGRATMARSPEATPAATTPPAATTAPPPTAPPPPPEPGRSPPPGSDRAATWTGSGSATPAARRGRWPRRPTSPGC